MDRQINTTGESADFQGIVCGLLYRDIARHRGDRGDFKQLWRAQRQQDRKGVILPRIGINQNTPFHVRALSPPVTLAASAELS
ncbi:hypothetical protein N4R57_11095 [Rhodobacteraceae bacterium D3-12]|nr:hypothetical protein N4R57_11095 [Rhodobacteraceae bacterium D3-12]